MKNKIFLIYVIVSCLSLASCSSLIGQRQVEIPLEKLQQGLDKKFPLENKYLEIFNVSLTNPKLTLQPETSRITAIVDAVVAPFFLKQERKGRLSFSGRLQFDAMKSAVVLTDVRIENVFLDGKEMSDSKQIAGISRLLADQLQKSVALYTFKSEDLRYAGVSFVVSGIVTKPDALVVIFEPAK